MSSVKQYNPGFCLLRVYNDPGLPVSSVKSPFVTKGHSDPDMEDFNYLVSIKDG